MSRSSGSPGSSGFSGSSLLHLRRPLQLREDARPQLRVVRNDSDSDLVNSVCSSPTASIGYTSKAFCPPPPYPSLKLDTSTNDLLQAPRPLRRAISDTHITAPSPLGASPDKVETCLDLLRFVQPSACIAKPRSQWQPDKDSVFCNQTSCTTMFGQTALSFGPRRHHCRLCGLIFCNEHSTGRLPLMQGRNSDRPVLSRVCDGCLSMSGEAPTLERRFSDATPSLVDSEASATDDHILDPEVTPLARSTSCAAFTTAPSVAATETWTDRSGILSLYPLAVQASHSRRSRKLSSPVTAHVVGPLFAPSLSERRHANDKEQARLSERRRRNVCVWLAKPAAADDDSEDVSTSPTRSTGCRNLKELSWSTF